MKKKQLHRTIRCSGCGTCCSIPIVPVTDNDVRRIATTLKINACDIVRFYSPSEIEFDRDAEVWIKFRYGRRAMGLRRKKEKCMFLNDASRCTIYQSRPMTCRTFPYVIDYDNNDNMTVELNDIVKCKCTKVPDSLLTDVLDNTLTEDLEDEKYFQKIRIWNLKNSDGGTEDFLRHCGLL